MRQPIPLKNSTPGTLAAWRGSWALRLLAVSLAVVLVLACAQLSWACPTCKDGLSQNDPQRANLVQGYFWSILFMMSMPFLLLSALGGYFYYEVRKAQRLIRGQESITAERG